MIEVSEVRKRLVHAIDRARRAAAEERLALESVRQDYERFLETVATPVFRMFTVALKAEGHLFSLSTPRGSVRMAPERSSDDFIEVALDSSRRPPVVVGRAVHTRGREVTSVERVIRERAAVSDLTDEDVLEFLLAEIGPFVER
jgi:hypothetical protein